MNDFTTPGTRVTGIYLDTPISGTVNDGSRYHTMNPNVIVVFVNLDTPTDIGGLVRDAVCCEVALDGGFAPGFGLASLTLSR